MAVALKAARAGSVPHSNQAVAACPFGFTMPFKVAPLMVTEFAAFVVAVGDTPGGASIVKVAMRTEKESSPEKTR